MNERIDQILALMASLEDELRSGVYAQERRMSEEFRVALGKVK